jgi:hypothetical protein
MTENREWDLLLNKPTVSFSQEELLLLDWVLCSASGMVPGADLGELMMWDGLRQRVWLAYMGQGSLVIGETEARQLLALTPTTFRWGVGADVGLTLKQKLVSIITGVPYANTNDKAQSQAENYTGC